MRLLDTNLQLALCDTLPRAGQSVTQRTIVRAGLANLVAGKALRRELLAGCDFNVAGWLAGWLARVGAQLTGAPSRHHPASYSCTLLQICGSYQ